MISFVGAGCGGDDKAGVNGACVVDGDCSEGLCHDRVCHAKQRRATGESCEGAGDCQSSRCTEGKCAAGDKGPGRRCLHDAECRPGTRCVEAYCALTAVDGGKPDGAAPDSAAPDGSSLDAGADGSSDAGNDARGDAPGDATDAATDAVDAGVGGDAGADGSMDGRSEAGPGPVIANAFGLAGLAAGSVESIVAVDRTRFYVGGSGLRWGSTAPHNIAYWDGSRWSELGKGVDGAVDAMALVGQTLYVAGRFASAGGATANAVARWDITARRWSALGTGLRNASGATGTASAIAVVGTSHVFVAGFFQSAGSSAAVDIARFDVAGQTWSALGGGLNDGNGRGYAVALHVVGNDLYVGGTFTKADGKVLAVPHIARYSVASGWSGVGSTAPSGWGSEVSAIDDVGGDPYAANFDYNKNATALFRFSGGAWSSGVSVAGYVDDLQSDSTGGLVVASDVGSPRRLTGTPSNPVLSALGAGLRRISANGTVVAAPATRLARFADVVLAAGRFDLAGDAPARDVASWTASWAATCGANTRGVHYPFDRNGKPLAATSPVRAVAAAVTGGDVFVGGGFVHAGCTSASRIAHWNVSAGRWRALGAGVDDEVLAIAIDGKDVYVGGRFTKAGGQSAAHVARWNRWTSTWHTLGTGLDGDVRALAVVGGRLYAAGDFTKAGGVTASRIASFDGTSWSALGAGVDGPVNALVEASGTLYVGGAFGNAGGAAAKNIASYTSGAWKPLGAGLDGAVRWLVVEGGGIVAAGSFGKAGAQSVSNRMARWDGSAWKALGTDGGSLAPLAVDRNGRLTRVTTAGSIEWYDAPKGRWEVAAQLPSLQWFNGISGATRFAAITYVGQSLFIVGNFINPSSSPLMANVAVVTLP